MQTDVIAVEVKASGVVSGDPARLKALHVTYKSGSTVKLRDGGASGKVRFSFTAPETTGTTNISVPAQGVRFYKDIYAEVTDASATVFYG